MKSIIIIGAGFSGVALVAQLIRQACTAPLRIVLINRSGGMARGLAYGTQSPDHVLNVPVGNMSAIAEDPDHFLNFVRQRDTAVEPSSFVLRSIYGDYLESLLKEAEQSLRSNISLERITGEVAKIDPGLEQTTVALANGHVIKADKVVLAFGHFASPHPPGAEGTLHDCPRYLRDPWNTARLDGIPATAPVLIIGTGLTAIDACMSLLNAAPGREIRMVSRRGLLPKTHRPGPPRHSAHSLPPLFSQSGTTVRQLLRAFRGHVRTLEQSGEDWREALNQIRPITHNLWQGWSEAERRRFLRHVQPYWDNHRHRAAPRPFARFEEALHAGLVKVHAGRIASFNVQPSGVAVNLQLRGLAGELSIDTEYVVNCIGPNCDLTKAGNPLVSQLLVDGMITADPLRLGIAVDSECRVMRADGRPSNGMYYIGPLLKARYWEATAVPELRKFASSLAKTLLQ